MIKNIKEIHSKDLCLFKMGSFYHAYGKDAYILSYLFGYKIKEIGNLHKECGFPSGTISKVIAKLENNQINYLLIDRRNEYDVEEKENYKNLNRYERFYEKAKKYVNVKKRIENITDFLIENIETEDIGKLIGSVEKAIYEGRKV